MDGDWASGGTERWGASPQYIDQELRRIAKVRAGLDAEEARWLRRADNAAIWNELGYVHALEYLEAVFGYSPRTAQERLRVARELESLTEIEAALDAGELPYSVVRELTRVATPDTEGRWLERARGLPYRQVEQLVAGRKKGDDPTDAPDPDLIPTDVHWKLSAATAMLLRETRARLGDELGSSLDDDQFVEMLCRRAFETSSSNHEPARTIHMTTCRSCNATTQDGAGVRLPVDENERSLAACDATIVDDEHGLRARSQIPPVTRRKVFERDEHRCRFPGCRSARNLDVHHIVHQEHGGAHEPSNLMVLCSGHHRLLHRHVIAIEATPEGFLFRRDGREVSNATRPTPTANERLATQALRQAGYAAATASRAVERALARVRADAELEELVRTALQLCT